MIILREALLKDKKSIYDWMSYYSNPENSLNSGSSTVINYEMPSIEEFFNEDFPDYFFTGEQPENGMCFIIQNINNGIIEDIGTIQYTAFHLNKGIAEFDIWMKSNDYCGKGYGVEAIKLLVDKVKNIGFKIIIIRPIKQNKRAINAYKKAGFKSAKLELEKYYKPEFMEKYGCGDCGIENDEFMTLNL